MITDFRFLVHFNDSMQYLLIVKRCELHGFSAIQCKYYLYYYYLTMFTMLRLLEAQMPEHNLEPPRFSRRALERVLNDWPAVKAMLNSGVKDKTTAYVGQGLGSG